jgi:spore photoproduct lyase
MERYTLFRPQSILIEEAAIDLPISQRVLSRLPDTPVTTTPSLETSDIPASLRPETLTSGKRVLVIRRQRGRFLKSCPGCTETLHCNYQVLHQAENCHLECTYCFLQGWLNNYTMTLFANDTDIYRELEVFETENPGRAWRLGTGEFTDSLALDHLTDQSLDMVEFFRPRPHYIFEIKTKTVSIDNLLTCKAAENIVIAWSVNPPAVIDKEEFKCPILDDRLAAARRCVEHGYTVGFHFDPILYFDGWEAQYHAVVEKIYTACPPESVRWISLGTFRFPPAWKRNIAERFPNTDILYGEHVVGGDGKCRYLKRIRSEMYTSMYRQIREHSQRTWVYLCMEPREMWERVFGWSPRDDAEMERCYTEGYLPPV